MRSVTIVDSHGLAWLVDSETSSPSHGSFARGGWTRLARESSTRLESMRAERYPYDVI